VSLDIAAIRARFPGREIRYYESLDSTMHAAAGLETGAVVLADAQRAGMGRHGHSWHSERGNGIYCSMVLEVTPVLMLALGLAAADAIALTTGMACDLRWPNDVMIGSRKVGGILAQLLEGKAVAGIGINVNHPGFPPELEREATSLAIEGGRRFAREDIICALIAAIDTHVAHDTETTLRLFTHASSFAAGRRVRVDQPGGIVEGVTAGLNPEGFLIVRKDDGTDTVIYAGGVRAAGS
jgi:BirA family biotin operon repressor/biotin-[acetyl-CoA-carboxylase] ligase